MCGAGKKCVMEVRGSPGVLLHRFLHDGRACQWHAGAGTRALQRRSRHGGCLPERPATLVLAGSLRIQALQRGTKGAPPPAPPPAPARSQDGKPKCIPPPDACQLVVCPAGKVCKNKVSAPGGGSRGSVHVLQHHCKPAMNLQAAALAAAASDMLSK